jgi:hypothetical protein
MNKRGSIAIAILVSAVALVVVFLVGDKLNLTGFSIDGNENVLVETASVEIWADTNLEIVKENGINFVLLNRDDGKILPGKSIEFYSNNVLVSTKTTDKKGMVEYSKNSYNIIFQSDEKEFLNPSFIDNSTRFVEEESICREFTENVLWSSGYSNNAEGSTNYEIWYPENNCSNCFVSEIELETRFLSFVDENINGYGSIQISELVNCENPENENYEIYLVSETIKGEGRKHANYKGQQTIFDFNPCYGIKLYADRNFIVDVFKIKYALCSETIEVKNE